MIQMTKLMTREKLREFKEMDVINYIGVAYGCLPDEVLEDNEFNKYLLDNDVEIREELLIEYEYEYFGIKTKEDDNNG